MICDITKTLDIRKLWLRGMKRLNYDGVYIRISTTEVTFGGTRPWFHCPACDRRCAVLYAPDYHCRLCVNGRYLSELASPKMRASLRARKIQRKLQMAPNEGLRLPLTRPKGMHMTTFRALIHEVAELHVILKGVRPYRARRKRKVVSSSRHPNREIGSA